MAANGLIADGPHFDPKPLARTKGPSRASPIGTKCERKVLAGQRPSSSAAATSFVGLNLGLLSDLQRIVDLDPEVSDRTFECAVTEQ